MSIESNITHETGAIQSAIQDTPTIITDVSSIQFPDIRKGDSGGTRTRISQTQVLSIFGTRPEAIKMAPVIAELGAQSGVMSKVCVTGQHREMLDQALDLFDIVPDFDLNLMQKTQTPTRIAAAAIEQLEGIFEAARPDWVLVHGDTTTAAAASIAAFYAGIKVGHVEAGLRSHDKWHPFPEEVNRRLISVSADMHFAPTENARQNLLREGISDSQIFVTGNTVIDALHWVQRLPWNPGSMSSTWSRIKRSHAKLILVTAHRRESFGEPIEQVCEGIRALSERYGDEVLFFYPVHRNPKIWEPVHRILDGIPNIILSSPLAYVSLIHFMKRSHIVLTDSGGIQEEGPALGVPVLVLRDVTERPEAVASGNVRLVGTDRSRIVSEVSRLLDDPEAHNKMARSVNPYGDGHAAERIARAILS
jgi:UDP-N-acetylglucosamine 2-epimerase